MESPAPDRRWVIEHLAIHAPVELVEHAEQTSSEQVNGEQFEVWDVHTDRGRWWVITNPTQMYDQRDFKSMDRVLSYHIGFTARVLSRQSLMRPDPSEPHMKRTRRHLDQAAVAQSAADDPKDFQTVGKKCRESLLSFSDDMASHDILPFGVARPRDNDFVRWSELIADALTHGSRSAALRRYLKAVSRETWDYVSWLTYEENATRADSELAIQLTDNLLSVFESAIDRMESHLRELRRHSRITEEPKDAIQTFFEDLDINGALVEQVELGNARMEQPQGVDL